MAHVYLAADHAGFDLKRALAARLATLGHEVIDLGATTLDPEDDYPDYILPIARAVAAEEGSRGIAIGGSGQGEAMAANRVPGARAAVFYGLSHHVGRTTSYMGDGEEAAASGGPGGYDIVRLAREHNDANILSIGARFVGAAEADEAVRIFLTTPFSGENGEDARHSRRLAKF